MIPKEFETISEYVCKQTRWTDGSIRHDRMEDVVRCKDCIVFGTHGKNTDICPMWHNTHIDPYRDFCSRGVRKTENSSEKPNNCEPKICDTCRYYNSNIPCGSTPSACKEADKFAEEFVDGLKKLKSTDEPQTDCDGCQHYADTHTADACYECKRSYTDCYVPQTDCPWK